MPQINHCHYGVLQWNTVKNMKKFLIKQIEFHNMPQNQPCKEMCNSIAICYGFVFRLKSSHASDCILLSYGNWSLEYSQTYAVLFKISCGNTVRNHDGNEAHSKQNKIFSNSNLKNGLIKQLTSTAVNHYRVESSTYFISTLNSPFNFNLSPCGYYVAPQKSIKLTENQIETQNRSLKECLVHCSHIGNECKGFLYESVGENSAICSYLRMVDCKDLSKSDKTSLYLKRPACRILRYS